MKNQWFIKAPTGGQVGPLTEVACKSSLRGLKDLSGFLVKQGDSKWVSASSVLALFDKLDREGIFVEHLGAVSGPFTDARYRELADKLPIEARYRRGLSGDWIPIKYFESLSRVPLPQQPVLRNPAEQVAPSMSPSVTPTPPSNQQETTEELFPKRKRTEVKKAKVPSALGILLGLLALAACCCGLITYGKSLQFNPRLGQHPLYRLKPHLEKNREVLWIKNYDKTATFMMERNIGPEQMVDQTRNRYFDSCCYIIMEKNMPVELIHCYKENNKSSWNARVHSTFPNKILNVQSRDNFTGREIFNPSDLTWGTGEWLVGNGLPDADTLYTLRIVEDSKGILQVGAEGFVFTDMHTRKVEWTKVAFGSYSTNYESILRVDWKPGSPIGRWYSTFPVGSINSNEQGELVLLKKEEIVKGSK